MWAYPREFRDADAAGQVDDSPNRFSRPSGASHLFLLTQGYAILDGPAMPIVGEGEAEPNDSYVEQLVSERPARRWRRRWRWGWRTADRVAVGGHSYGAFMTANLLAHTDLFRAGIARSGAYNRTLTPFGFQQEQRSYWEAPETYNRMSPFTHADRIDGAASSSSTARPTTTRAPSRSRRERFYHALKGHGATVRYVVAPAREPRLPRAGVGAAHPRRDGGLDGQVREDGAVGSREEARGSRTGPGAAHHGSWCRAPGARSLSGAGQDAPSSPYRGAVHVPLSGRTSARTPAGSSVAPTTSAGTSVR